MAVQVYELYPTDDGGFSTQSRDYDGRSIGVAATSVKQAYALAHRGAWATDPDDPLGVLWGYDKGRQPAYKLFTGQQTNGNQVSHGEGKRAIGAWMLGVLAGN